jgi:hypothetical protein
MYVTTCPVTFQLKPQTVPDSEQSSEKRGFNCEELRDRYTGHPEVPPRNWAQAIHAPKDTEKCGDLDPPTGMSESTLFRGVLSNPWHLDQVSQT